MSESGSITSAIRDYVKLTESIDTMTKNLKELKFQRSISEETITQHMEENGIPKLNVGSRSFSLVVSKKNTKKVNKQSIKDCLLDRQIDDNTASYILDDLYTPGDADTVEVTKLKYTK
jgi:hypothetical protein